MINQHLYPSPTQCWKLCQLRDDGGGTNANKSESNDDKYYEDSGSDDGSAINIADIERTTGGDGCSAY